MKNKSIKKPTKEPIELSAIIIFPKNVDPDFKELAEITLMPALDKLVKRLNKEIKKESEK